MKFRHWILDGWFYEMMAWCINWNSLGSKYLIPFIIPHDFKYIDKFLIDTFKYSNSLRRSFKDDKRILPDLFLLSLESYFEYSHRDAFLQFAKATPDHYTLNYQSLKESLSQHHAWWIICEMPFWRPYKCHYFLRHFSWNENLTFASGSFIFNFEELLSNDLFFHIISRFKHVSLN